MWIVFAQAAAGQVTVGSSGSNHATIADAIANSVPGDTLTIAAGVYPGTLSVPHDLVVLGTGVVEITGYGGVDAVVSLDPGVALTLVGVRLESDTCRGLLAPADNVLVLDDVELATVTTGQGGGIAATDPVSVTLSAVRFEGTVADLDGGGLYVAAQVEAPVDLTDTAFVGAVARADAYGGGIAAYNVALSCVRCTFTGGSATYGGGLYHDSGSSLVVEDSTFEGNTALGGGGALGWDDVADARVARTSFCGNTAGFVGGAIASAPAGGTVDVANATFVGNSSPLAGALYAVEGDWLVRNSTFARNDGTSVIEATTSAEVDLVNDAVLDSTGLAVLVTPSGTADVRYGLVWNNAGGDFSGATSVFVLGADPALVAFTDDGDCTNDVLAPQLGSPLVDAGDPAYADPDGSVSDIGVTGGPDADPAYGIDADGDGWSEVFDCDDAAVAVQPWADEHCDGVDEDCDVSVDEDAVDAPLWHHDCDGDGQVDPSMSYVGCFESSSECADGAWIVSEVVDCDDSDPTAYQGAPELCAAGDQDCDGDPDLGAIDALSLYLDADGDGVGSGSAVLACGESAGVVAATGDCDDADASSFPGNPEVCDGRDNDCAGGADDGLPFATYYPDADGDGFGDASAAQSTCDGPPNGFTSDATDCDDAAAATYPSATDACGDGVDQDCSGFDGLAADLSDWVPDADGDGFGDAGAFAEPDCADRTGQGYVPATQATDCDDARAGVHPGAAEVCNGLDDDCDDAIDDAGIVQTWFPDDDDDGFGDEAGAVATGCPDAAWVLEGGDCDDTEAGVNPDADEVCNGVDDDCDDAIDDGALVQTWYADADGDGYGDDAAAVDTACPEATWVLVGGDCDDARADVNPVATEACNGADDDCDGEVDAADPEAVGTVDGWPDADGDGFGGCPDAACEPAPVCLSDLGAGWDDAHSDCDDADPGVNPMAEEVPGNDIDEDCQDGPAEAAGGPAKGCGCSGSPPPAGLAGMVVLGVARRRSRP